MTKISYTTYTASYDTECPSCFGDIWQGMDEYGWVDDEAVCESCWLEAQDDEED